MRSINLFNKHGIFCIVSTWFILTQTLPFFNVYVPVSPVLIYPIFLAICFMLFPGLFEKKTIKYQFFYVLIAFFFFLLGNPFYGQIGRVTTPLLLMTAGLVIIEYTLKYDLDYKYTRLVVYTVILTNIIMTILSYPQILAFPNIIRYAFSSAYSDRYMNEIPWLIQYETCHGLPLLFAPLAFLCRRLFQKKVFLFWLFLLIAFVLFGIVYLSNATTALILASLMIILGYFFDYEEINRKNAYGVIFIFLLGLLLTSKTVMIPILDGVQTVMDESWSNYHKIEELKTNLLTGESEGDLEEREDMYTSSLMLFGESPIIGTSKPEKLSHHSFFLDRLACLGIFLVIPLALVFVYNYKSVFKGLVHAKIVYMYGFFGWMLLLTLKADFGQGSWLYGFAFLPLFCRYVDYTIDNKK